MKNLIIPRAPRNSIPILPVSANEYKSWLKKQPATVSKWLKAQSFDAKPNSHCVISDASGNAKMVIAGLSNPVSMWDIAGLTCKLPHGTYHLKWNGSTEQQEKLALGWILGAYNFSRYKKSKKTASKLAITEKIDFDKVENYAEAICLTRDLINTPASDMDPEELADITTEIGKRFGAKVTQIIGDELLNKNYPAIHAVGRASVNTPRLIDLIWGNPKHQLVTLVGKGVCFDTGGLDIKRNMSIYKKDMGGAACALGIAFMVMSQKLPVRLRLLIPAVENSISGNAFRSSDIIKMRNGLNVEVGNTDAEGRMILADCLTEASTENPSIIIDFATLTGAARSAVGACISALFVNNDELAKELLASATDTEDHLWRLPLYEPYESMLDSKIADINSCPNSPYAGAITAALFLQRFVGKKTPWAHLDFMAWNLSAKSGRPEGGEAMALRAVYHMLERRVKTELKNVG